MFLRIFSNAPFSRRETWACEMPISPAISICVLPPQKRAEMIRRSFYESFAIASFRAMSSSQRSSSASSSRIWSITQIESPPSLYTAS